eukprot:302414_1
MEGFKTRTENAEILIEKAAEAREGPLFTSLLSVVTTSVMQQAQSPTSKGIMGIMGIKGIKRVNVGKALKNIPFINKTSKNPVQQRGLPEFNYKDDTTTLNIRP